MAMLPRTFRVAMFNRLRLAPYHHPAAIERTGAEWPVVERADDILYVSDTVEPVAEGDSAHAAPAPDGVTPKHTLLGQLIVARPDAPRPADRFRRRPCQCNIRLTASRGASGPVVDARRRPIFPSSGRGRARLRRNRARPRCPGLSARAPAGRKRTDRRDRRALRPRARLRSLFWPDRTAPRASASLRNAPSVLRSELARLGAGSRDGDSPVLPDLLGQIPAGEQTGTVTADGAHDTRRCHKAIIERDAVPIIPIRQNGRFWKEDCPAARARNNTLRATRYYGRAFWKRRTGYHARSRIEAKMRCLKSFGERIMARDPDRQTAEIHIRIALMNRFNALGTAEIVRVA